MQRRKQQESRIVAINADPLTATPLRVIADPLPTAWLKRLIDSGTLYIPQNLNPIQFATLQAITLVLSHPGTRYAACRLDACLVTSAGDSEAGAPPIAFDYRLGLDELENITRTRTGYSFTELHPDLQDAILSLIASRDLTSRRLDIARWLGELHTHTLALAA